MSDPTESIRRQQVAEINASPNTREGLEARYGKEVWDTSQLQQEFRVLGFMAPYVVVMRKSDGVRGCITFQHDPRLYFGFEAD